MILRGFYSTCCYHNRVRPFELVWRGFLLFFQCLVERERENCVVSPGRGESELANWKFSPENRWIFLNASSAVPFSSFSLIVQFCFIFHFGSSALTFGLFMFSLRERERVNSSAKIKSSQKVLNIHSITLCRRVKKASSLTCCRVAAFQSSYQLRINHEFHTNSRALVATNYRQCSSHRRIIFPLLQRIMR